jgi:hypothetical protein
MSKKQNLHTKFFAKNQLIIKLACLMQHRRKYEAKIVMKVRVLKLKYVNSTMCLIDDSSNNVMYCDVCRKAGSDITGKTEFVTGKKKCKHENLVY